MRLLLVADGHYYKTPSGKVYAESVYSYAFYKRYLAVFEEVHVAVRMTSLASEECAGILCSGPGIVFLELPAYRGPYEYALKFLSIQKRVSEVVEKYECAIFRLPGATANTVCSQFAKTGKPFAVEVVVDPWVNFAPGAVRSVVRPIVRIKWTNFLKEMVRKADGVSYVTEDYLQRRYPSGIESIESEGQNRFTAHYSSVELPDDGFKSPRTFAAGQFVSIAHVANSFSGYGKGHQMLMDALAIVLQDGFSASVTFVGDGPLRGEFEAYAKAVGIADSVRFVGRMPDSAAVRKVISDSDLFVFPTQAEGLPRVLLEAMAEGLPCISTNVCGIPEILNQEFLCDYGDSSRLAEIIESMISDSNNMNEQSRKNILVAKKFSSTILNSRRFDFYSRLRKVAENRGANVQ